MPKIGIGRLAPTLGAISALLACSPFGADGADGADGGADASVEAGPNDARAVPSTAKQWSNGVGATFHFYEIVVDPGIKWPLAKAAALSRGGHLASLTTREENAFVAALAKESPMAVNGTLGPWLGGVRPRGSQGPGGGWTWVTGEPWNYENWAMGEPENNGDTVLGFYQNPSWADYAEDSALVNGYVVEYE